MQRRTLTFLAFAGMTAAGALSCASQSAATATSTSPSTPPPPPEGPEPLVGPPQVAWKDMTKQQRGRYMAMAVMPKMKEVFRAFDANKFATFNCATCHGPGAKDHSFDMPNPELFVLPAPAEFAPLMQKEPEWVKFMAEQVKPQMATLLGMKEYDPQNPNPQPGTFSCHNCHNVKGP